VGKDKLHFGESVRKQIGERIRRYVEVEKKTTFRAAADSLGISRQRLHSYTSGKSFPRLEVFDKILSTWELDLLGGGAASSAGALGVEAVGQPEQRQFNFEEPLTLSNDSVKVVIERVGRKLVARVEIRAAVKIA
jgi:transcriptional regulator with XRE-family HTH domain